MMIEWFLNIKLNLKILIFFIKFELKKYIFVIFAKDPSQGNNLILFRF